jgi:hypothetical protein
MTLFWYILGSVHTGHVCTWLCDYTLHVPVCTVTENRYCVLVRTKYPVLVLLVTIPDVMELPDDSDDLQYDIAPLR